jgi:Tat protein translocase TatC
MTDERAPAGPRPEAEMAVMSLGEHLEELRSRLIRCLVALALVFVLCWAFRSAVIEVIKRPHVRAMAAYELEGVLNYRSYFEPIVAQLKACALVALILASPVVIYQVWAFVAPGLFPHERRKVVLLGAACVLCFGAAVCFGYFVFIPIALRYLLGFALPGTRPVLMISDYLTAFFLLTFALGVAFQTPVVVYYLVRWGVLDPASLQSKRKGVVLGAFVLAAVITPPDPLTQIMMALTLIVLYDLGGLLAAPSAATFKGFVRFTGAIVLAGGALAAWYHFWPVGELTALAGGVTLDGQAVAAEAPAPVRRGALCRTGEGGRARLALGGEGGPDVLIGPASLLRVRDGRSLVLQRGDVLAASPGRAAELTVHAGPASVLVSDAEAELRAPDLETLTLTVLRGSVEAKVGAEASTIRAGRTATFRSGGRPADLTEVQQRWSQAKTED